MKPRIFIHIGTHKTGSTAIQRALLSGAKGLVRLLYHEDISRASWGTEDVQRLVALFHSHKTADASTKYLLSNERFSGEPLSGYADAQMMAERVRDITADFDPKIIVYLRRQDDFIESMYTQMIHQGGSLSFQAFLQQIQPERMNWHRLLETHSGVFGRENMIVRRYHSDFYPKPESLLHDFCEIVGIKPEDVTEKNAASTPNVGYSREALELARKCNPQFDAAEKKQLRKMLQKLSPKPFSQNYSYLDLDSRRQILAACADSNAAVRRDYFSHLLAGESLFPEPVESAATEAEEDKLTPMLVKMLVQSQLAERESGILRFAHKLERLKSRLRGKES